MKTNAVFLGMLVVAIVLLALQFCRPEVIVAPPATSTTTTTRVVTPHPVSEPLAVRPASLPVPTLSPVAQLSEVDQKLDQNGFALSAETHKMSVRLPVASAKNINK